MKYFLVSLLLVLSFGVMLSFAPNIIPLISRQQPIDPLALTGQFDPSAADAIFNNEKIPAGTQVADAPMQSPVLGLATGEKVIKIDLTHQRLNAYQGGQLIYSFLVSTGKWHPTPTGVFHIWTKMRYVHMVGGNPLIHTYYNLPNVPFVMFWAGGRVSQADGFGIHGTYWHHNFGHPMSHGCINMKTEEAAILYNWAQPDLRGQTSMKAATDNPGTEVDIFGAPPANEVSFRD